VTGDAAGSRSAEVSHEALIRHWEKLRAWIDENREKLRIRAALMAARAEWLRHKRHPSLLIEPGLRLEAARQLRDQPGDVVIDEVKDYIEASFVRDARRRLWRTGGFVAVAAIAVVMAGLAWVALNLKERAEEQSALAEQGIKASLETATKLAERVGYYAENGQDLTKALIELLNLAVGALGDLGRIKSTLDLRPQKANLSITVHDAFMNLGDTQQALEKARDAKATALELVAIKPTNPSYQALVYRSCFRVGDALVEHKELAEARDQYECAMKIAEQYADQDKSNVEWQKNLQFIYDKKGDLLKEQGALDLAYDEYQKAKKIEEQFTNNRGDPNNPDVKDWQRRLAATYNRIGQLYLEKEDAPNALNQFREALKITNRLAEDDPDNLGFKYTLSVRHSRMGSTLRKLGDADGAMTEFNSSLELRKLLFAKDRCNTPYLNLLASSHSEIGDALMGRDLKGAIEHYRSAEQIRQDLALKDPRNVAWQEFLTKVRGKLDAASAQNKEAAPQPQCP
jgi:tetratricopeptide (TPR) repeat protein